MKTVGEFWRTSGRTNVLALGAIVGGIVGGMIGAAATAWAQDLIVDGKIGAGVPQPAAKLHIANDPTMTNDVVVDWGAQFGAKTSTGATEQFLVARDSFD